MKFTSLEALKNPKIRQTLLTWMIFWFFAAGTSIYILAPHGADQLNNFSVTSISFLVFSAFGAWYYRIDQRLPHQASLKIQGVSIFLLTVLLVIIGLYIVKKFPLSEITQKEIMLSKFYFPLFRIETFITKTCDILFQQVFIYGILKKLKQFQFSNKVTIELFSICFFIIHLPLILSLKMYAFYFIVPSLFAGFIFSYFILNYRFGLVLAFAVHFCFYLSIGIYLRL